MRSIESEGEDIDDAIDKALRALQVGRDRVQIEILDGATRGVFGFGAKKARVRATVRPPLSSHDGEATEPVSLGTGDLRVADTPVERVARPVGDETVRAKDVLERILLGLGLSCTVVVRSADDPGTVVLDVQGDSGGLVIGRRGQTLDAIEYLVNRIAGRDENAAGRRFIVDAERYRDRRRQYLTDLARRVASKVQQTGRPVTLDPMTPRDRRIVHLEIQEIPGVASRSEGDGFQRSMLILPADGRGPARRSDGAR